MNTFIFVRRIRFLFDNYIWMRCHKVCIIKRDVADDAQSVGDNAKLEDIAKMTIDIKLFNLRISRSMGGYGAICSLVGIIRFSKSLSFGIGFKQPNNPVSILRIVFNNKRCRI